MKRLLLLLALSCPVIAFPCSTPGCNWATGSWTQLTMPAGWTGADRLWPFCYGGYCYVSEKTIGLYRQSVADINTNAGNWVATTGVPVSSVNGAQWAVCNKKMVYLQSLGKITCVFSDTSRQYFGTLDLNTLAWTTVRIDATTSGGNASIRTIADDYLGNLYSDLSGTPIWKSADGGTTWQHTSPANLGNPYGGFGCTTGTGVTSFYPVGGAGGYFLFSGDNGSIQTPYSMASVTRYLVPSNSHNCPTGPQTPDYSHNQFNLFCFECDRNTVPAHAILIGTDVTSNPPGSFIQRVDVTNSYAITAVETNTLAVFGCAGISTNNWQSGGGTAVNRNFSAGMAAGEVVASGGATGTTCNGTTSGVGGVLGSLDYGVTWTFIGGLLNCAGFSGSNFCPDATAVDPTTDTMLLWGNGAMYAFPGIDSAATYYLPLRH